MITRHLHQLADPARPDAANEDVLWTGADTAVLVDGAGLPKEHRAGCHHSVAWFAGAIAGHLGHRLEGSDVAATDALGAAIATVAAAHGPGCDLAVGSPSGTVVAWRAREDEVELLVLCDSSVILVDEGNAARPAHEVSDDRIDTAIRPRVEALLEQDARDGVAVDGARRWAHHRSVLEQTRNTADGFWCVHSDPDVADEALSWVVPTSDLTHLILASDGATRAYQLLGTHTLEEFVADCLGGRLEQIRDSVRAAETAAQEELRAAGRKVHDDLTILVSAVGRSSSGA